MLKNSLQIANQFKIKVLIEPDLTLHNVWTVESSIVKSKHGPKGFLMSNGSKYKFLSRQYVQVSRSKESRWKGRREVFVSPSDNPCLDNSSNMEVECKHHITVWIFTYLSPSIHLPKPTLPYTDFPYHFFYHCAAPASFSKSHLLKIAQGLPVTFLLRRTLYLLPTWNCCCISIRFIPLLNLSLCVHYVALLVFHCMEQSGCASICRPLLPNSIVCTFVTATDYNGCTVHAMIKLLSHPNRCLTSL